MPELAEALAALLAEGAPVTEELTPMPIPVWELPPVIAPDVVAAAVPLLLALIVSTVPLQVTPGAKLVSCLSEALDATALGIPRSSGCPVPV